MPADLIISEYVEGSSNNKAIELYNGTDADIDLGALGYAILMYFNGAGTVGTRVNLVGTIPAGGTFVLAHSSANAIILGKANQTNGSSWYNGDDAIVLVRGTTVVDSVGQVGSDPGTEWGTGLTSTADNTIVRKATVDAGDKITNDAFNPADQWDGYATDTFSGLGTHTGPTSGGAPKVTVAASDAQGTEGGETAFAFTFTRTGDLSQALTVTYTYSGSAAADDYAPAPTGTVTIPAGQASATVTFDVIDDAAVEPNETLTLTLVDEAAYDLGASASATATLVSDEIGVSRISEIQGTTDVSGMKDRLVIVEAVVTGDFQNGDADTWRDLGGFFVQEELVDEDGNPLTSEGLFIAQGSALTDVQEGMRVRVTGVVKEEFGRTQIVSTKIEVIGENALGDVRAATVTLPTASLEAYESMLVHIPQTLVITDQEELDRLGEVVLYATEGDGLGGAIDEGPDGRPYQFTQTNAPSKTGYAAHEAAVAARTIIYDDGFNGTYNRIQNPDGGGAYTTANAPQNGDSITGFTGVLDYGFNAFRLRSTEDGQNDFQDTNPREAEAADVGGSLTVGSFNVLNFFVTLNDGSRTDLNHQPRGADTQAEFDRQIDKLVTTIIAIDADVLALVELENDFSNAEFGQFVAAGNAIGYLVEQLNLALGDDVYSWVDPGSADNVGTDAISTGFIYKNDAVKIAEGTTARFDTSTVHERPPLAVTFQEIQTGAVFTAVAVHLRAKGSGSADALDGQARGVTQRMAQAEALAAFVASNPTGTTDEDYLLLGDFNANYMESPLQLLRDRGFVSTDAATSWSYTFNGQIGSLDHAIASASLADQVTGATKWHINSDEADALDYNLDGGEGVRGTRDPGVFDGGSAYRSSDHDAIIVGLNLRVAPVAADASVIVAEDAVLRAAVQATDGNRDPLTYSVVDGPDHGTLQLNADGSYVYTPFADYNGGDSFVFAASDGRLSDQGMVTLTVTPVNDAPVAGTPQPATVLEDGSVSIVVPATDVDGDALTIVGAASKLGASVTVDGNRIVYTADADAFDLLPPGASLVDEVTYRVSDGDLFSASVTVQVTVNERGDAALVWGSNKADLFTDEVVEGDTTWSGGEGDDTAFGAGGADVLYGGNGSDTLWGGAGADILDGGNGTDALYGGDGDDVLFGGHGVDVLTGGAGRDTFVLTSNGARDRIVDFNPDEDRIVFVREGDTPDLRAYQTLDFAVVLDPSANAPAWLAVDGWLM